MRGADAWQSPYNANALPDVEIFTLLELVHVQCLPISLGDTNLVIEDRQAVPVRPILGEA